MQLTYCYYSCDLLSAAPKVKNIVRRRKKKKVSVFSDFALLKDKTIQGHVKLENDVRNLFERMSIESQSCDIEKEEILGNDPEALDEVCNPFSSEEQTAQYNVYISHSKDPEKDSEYDDLNNIHIADELQEFQSQDFHEKFWMPERPHSENEKAEFEC